MSDEREPLRVLFCAGYGARRAGSQRSLLLLVDGLPPPVESQVVFLQDGDAVDMFVEQGLVVTTIPSHGLAGRYGKSLLQLSIIGFFRLAIDWIRSIPAYVGVLRSFNPDIVHFNDGRAALFGSLLAKVFGAKTVWHLRGRHIFPSSSPWNLVLRFTVDAVISVANALRQDVRWHPSVRTVHNGVVLGDPTKARHSVGTELLLASTLEPYKGHHVAFAAIALARETLDVRLTILSEARTRIQAEYMTYLKNLASTLEIQDYVTWVGEVPDVSKWIESSDVVLLPTVGGGIIDLGSGPHEMRCTEGLPRVLLEAMALARPVIASRVAGVEELVIHGETGLVVPPGDARRLAEAIVQLASDPCLRMRLAEAGFERAASEFSIPGMVDGVLAVYRDLLPGSLGH